ncbi:MAG: hypothetical protein KM312_04310 [Hydrogenibacillus schlegelii]|uniref:Nudix hydrolase domain-containing protein n=1 Tax=Hydrogenibacillus schlegelii TaxID=1484 RepID=A0A947D0J8_HYDSH|nr:hypothetical protein [Hydrogenibacillus schlegelii]
MRELFEETGILLVHGETPAENVVEVHRRSITSGQASFARFLRAYDLRPAPERLRYMGRLVTPPTEPRRFDTRFFLAVLSEGDRYEENRVQNGELIDQGWFYPEDILSGRMADFPLIPPTRYALEVISVFPTPEAAWEAFAPVIFKN